MNDSRKPPRALFWVFLFGLFVAIVVIAKANALTFPFPSEDDGSFFLPGWNLAVHGNLTPQVLHAPNGIYWMPHGYYFWQALFLKLFGPTMEVARSVSQFTTATAVVLLTIATAQITRTHVFAALCGLMLLSPPVIYTANTTRMESLILLLYALAILLHENRQYLPAAAMLVGSLLVHPALLVCVLLYVPVAGWLAYTNGGSRQTAARSRFPRWLGHAIVVLVLAALAAEALLVLRHADLFRQQMAFQVQRKAARTLRMILGNRRGILLCAEAVFSLVCFYALRWSGTSREVLRNIGPVLLIAIGLQTYTAFGYEQPYLVYAYSIVPAILLAAAFGAVGAQCWGEPMLSSQIPTPSGKAA